ncbi:hypothetical protein U5922_014495 [Aquicoccus sp. G2-2]|uniref:hypothetical protein n=1 Tax=Aquicoccus sp. G2-2 TaxID=3092120 RepID=UPI002AE0A2B3|nr:hypothetical protein [Aquicoccus sp. G2-2]MEA1114606.1 hypothetical protein [Aquicoccus sp. G2-2]
MSAELIYRKPNRIGRVPVSADPLSQIIACVGRKNIAAVTNYDEAAFQGISEKSVEALYNRVKQIDSTLPVFMVHAPILTDKPQFANTGHVDRYLEAVKRYSRYADVVGFDVYPVPSLISKAATPTSRLAVVGPDQAIAQYTAWVKANIPDKKTLIVLQGFAYTDLYAPEFVQKNVPAPLRAIIKPPSRNEIDSMVAQAKAAGVGVIIWWGQASLNSTEDAPWPDILRSARRHAD